MFGRQQQASHQRGIPHRPPYADRGRVRAATSSADAVPLKARQNHPQIATAPHQQKHELQVAEIKSSLCWFCEPRGAALIALTPAERCHARELLKIKMAILQQRDVNLQGQRRSSRTVYE